MKGKTIAIALLCFSLLAMSLSIEPAPGNVSNSTAHAEEDDIEILEIQPEDGDLSAAEDVSREIDMADSCESGVEIQGDDSADIVLESSDLCGPDGQELPPEELDGECLLVPHGMTESSAEDVRENSYRPTQGMSNESAMFGYIGREMYSGKNASWPQRTYGSVGNRLTGVEGKLYSLLRPRIVQVANGELANTEFLLNIRDLYENVAYTASDLGICSLTDEYGEVTLQAMFAFWGMTNMNVGRVIGALLADCPYDLYWYDKTSPTSWNNVTYELDGDLLRIQDYDTGVICLHFPVAAEYSASGRTGTYEVDTEKGQSVKAAAANTQLIIEACSSMSDLEKLTAYKNAICDLAEYNHAAASDDHVEYGNPWQLVWVFDGDPETNVVCEGYSKAFQYLCELSDFNGDVSVISVTGMMNNDRGGGGLHMWNLVTVGNVRYLADITNCDEGSVGAPDKLFMKGYSYCQEGSWGATYYFHVGNRTLNYTFENRITDLFSAEELDISDDPVGPDDASQSSGTCGDLKWKMDGNGVLYIHGSGAIPDYTAQDPAPWAGEDVVRAYLGKGITAIGSRAFYDCPNLTTISVKSGILSIGEDAFNAEKLRGYNVRGVIIPKCTDKAVIDYVNEVKVNHVINGHVSLVYKDPVPATCVSTGTRSAYCEGCGDIFEWNTPINRYNHAHVVNDKAEAATCTQPGRTSGSHCADCNTVIKAQQVVTAKGHTVVVDQAVPATVEREGRTEGRHCKVCGEVLVAQQVIPRLPAPTAKPTRPTATPTVKPTVMPTSTPTVKPTVRPTATPTVKPTVRPTAAPTVKPTPAPTAVPLISIERARVTVSNRAYTGKPLKPAAEVILNNTLLKKGTDYTVTYSNNKEIGTAVVTVKGKGRYTGQAKATFRINPKPVTGFSLKSGKGKLTAKWKASKGVSGYQLQYGTKKDLTSARTVSVARASTTRIVLKGLKRQKTYYARIRVYKKVKTRKYWSAWSGVKKVKVA